MVAGAVLIAGGLALAFFALTSATMNSGLFGAGFAILMAVVALGAAGYGVRLVVASRGGQ